MDSTEFFKRGMPFLTLKEARRHVAMRVLSGKPRRRRAGLKTTERLLNRLERERGERG